MATEQEGLLGYSDGAKLPGGPVVVSSGSSTGTNKVKESQTGPVAPIGPTDEPHVGTSPGPDVTLVNSLINNGYDPAKAQQIAQQLLANSSSKSTVSTSAGSITPGVATAGQAAAPTPIGPATYGGLLDYGTGIGIGNTDPTTRTVTEDELVANQLEGLLSGDSKYIRNARLRGTELSNQRGQFLSSFSAGAAERAAIEAGLPIATADAQAFRDAATQNLNALNNFALANIQRATAIDTELIGANTQISISNLDAQIRVNLANLDALTKISMANLDAETQTSIANLSAQTQTSIANLQAKLQLTMQAKEMAHQVGMEQLQQQGRVELTQLDGALRIQLEKFAQEGRIDLSKLDHEQTLEVNSILDGYNKENADKMNGYNRQAAHASAAQQAQLNYINYMTAYAQSDMDPAAAARLAADAWNNLVAEMGLINGLYPEFPPITPTRKS